MYIYIYNVYIIHIYIYIYIYIYSYILELNNLFYMIFKYAYFKINKDPHI